MRERDKEREENAYSTFHSAKNSTEKDTSSLFVTEIWAPASVKQVSLCGNQTTTPFSPSQLSHPLHTYLHILFQFWLGSTADDKVLEASHPPQLWNTNSIVLHIHALIESWGSVHLISVDVSTYSPFICKKNKNLRKHTFANWMLFSLNSAAENSYSLECRRKRNSDPLSEGEWHKVEK